MLGVPVLRVIVAAADVLGTADGASRPSMRVGRAAAIAAWLVVGSAEGVAWG